MNAKLAIRLAVLVIVGAAFAWILTRLDWREFGHRLLGASPVDLALMVLAWMVALLLRPVRFRFLVRTLGHVQGASYLTIWSAMVLAQAVNSFAPMRIGDVVLALFLRQRIGIAIHATATVAVADWACDFLCIVVLFVGALAFAPMGATWTSHAIVILIVALIAGGVGLSALIRWRVIALRVLDLALARLTPKWQERGLQIGQETMDGLATIAAWRVALPLILLSVLIWGFVGLSYWFGLRAVFADATMAAAAFSMAAVTLSFVVPLGPGGMGAFEAAAMGALSVFRVPLEPGLAFAVLAHSFQLLVVLLFAGFAVIIQRVDYRSLWSAAEKNGRRSEDKKR